MNVTTEEEHTNEPYDTIGNDNPPNQGLHPNFDVFDDFFEDSNEDVAKFAAEAGDVPQTSPANPVLPVPEPTGEPPTLSTRQRERLLQLCKNGAVSMVQGDAEGDGRERLEAVQRAMQKEVQRPSAGPKATPRLAARLETSTKRGTVNAGG